MISSFLGEIRIFFSSGWSRIGMWVFETKENRLLSMEKHSSQEIFINESNITKFEQEPREVTSISFLKKCRFWM